MHPLPSPPLIEHELDDSLASHDTRSSATHGGDPVRELHRGVSRRYHSYSAPRMDINTVHSAWHAPHCRTVFLCLQQRAKETCESTGPQWGEACVMMRVLGSYSAVYTYTYST